MTQEDPVVRVRRPHGTIDGLTTSAKCNVVCECILYGRPPSAAALVALSGPDAAEVKWRVWRRARKNPKLAMGLTDELKRVAEEFDVCRNTTASADIQAVEHAGLDPLSVHCEDPQTSSPVLCQL